MKVVHDGPSGLCQDGGAYAISPCRQTELLGRLPSREVSSATPPHHAVAQWLITAETGADDGPLSGSAAAGRVFVKLNQRLAQLITPVGAEALLKRAVHLCRTRFPFLESVEAPGTTDSVIDRLRSSAATVESGQATEGFVIVLATLVTLLESFIGQDLTFRLLGDVWPQLPKEFP
jgi:hypothetical protein